MKQFIIIIIICLVLGCISYVFSQERFQENKAPEVKFITPYEGDTFRRNDLVNYEISISDQEDGDTEYDEINVNEVFLVVKYLKDSVRQEDYLISETKMNYDPLVEMGTRSCLNCHKLNRTLIGPSFHKISEKYKEERGAVEKLAEKIIAGGSNVWGDVIMPSHQDLNISQAKELVNWILTYNFNADKEILVGTNGSFRIKESTEKSNSGIYVLTAFYTDHGINQKIQSRKRGQQTRILQLE